MVNKFFIYSLIFSVLCFLMMSSLVFATNTVTSTTLYTVGVTSNTTLTISLAGRYNNSTFSGFSTAISNKYIPYTLTTSDYIRVVDYTETSGHQVDVSFNDRTWSYNGSDLYKGDVHNMLTYAVPGDDAVLFYMVNSGATVSWSNKDANICTANSSTLTVYNSTNITHIDKGIATNTEACAGISRYRHGTIRIYGPQNGFGSGNYTQTATFTVTDGYP